MDEPLPSKPIDQNDDQQQATKSALKSKSLKPDFSKVKLLARETLNQISIYDFINPNKSWVLVANGSFCNFFDFVPPFLRTGPWTLPNLIFIFCMTYGLTFRAIQLYATVGLPEWKETFTNNYYNAFTIPWMLNLLGLCWTSYVFKDLYYAGMGK